MLKKIILLSSISFLPITLNAGIYCKNLHTCAEACNYLKQGYYRLDRDRDGIPCENLCHRPCSSSKKVTKKHTAKNTKHSKAIRHSEKYYQKAFCKKVLGIMEYKLKDGTRIDCYTSTYSFEVDFAKKAYQAIGQALHYADTINNKPGIVLILRKKSDIKYINRIKNTAKKHNIKLFTIDNNLKIKSIK